MNGRVYDYNLGRFMSVDPFIQGAGNSQAINPYSYVLNNPLSGTDPTGYSRLDTANGSITQGSQSQEDEIEEYNQKVMSVNITNAGIKSQSKNNGAGGNKGANDKKPESAVNIEDNNSTAKKGSTSGRNTSDIEKELGGSTFKTTEDGWTLNWSENVTREDKSDLVGESQDSFYVGLVDELTTQAQVLKNGKVDPNDTNDNFLIQGLNNSAYRKYTATSDVYENYTQVSGEMVYSLRNVNTNETRFLRRETISRRENVFRSATLRSVNFKGFVGVANLPKGTRPQSHLYLQQMQRSVGKNIIKFNLGGN